MPEVLKHIGDGSLDPYPMLSGPLDYGEVVEVLLNPPPGKPVFTRSGR